MTNLKSEGHFTFNLVFRFMFFLFLVFFFMYVRLYFVLPMLCIFHVCDFLSYDRVNKVRTNTFSD